MLSRVVKDALPDAISERFPRSARRTGPDWRYGLMAAGVALSACLIAAGALAWMGRQTGQAMNKIAFNYPYDDEESWFV
jgi:hypothetical protein